MLPFEKLKVIDFSQKLPGPYCSSILADLGADVIMVERVDSQFETRGVFPGLFELINKNKKSITLDLKQPEAKKLSENLIRDADVLLEGFRPGVADRLGIGYDQVKSINPAVIYCSISGFGQDGPYRDRVGHDINYLSLSGAMSIPGQPEVPPARPGLPVVDLASGMFAAIAVMAALRKRDIEGTGEYIDVSMFDAMISWMSVRAGRYLILGEKTENDHLSALNNIYETKDGKKLSLGILEQHFWQHFCETVGRPELLNDPRFSTLKARKENSSDLLKILSQIISERTLNEWDRIFDWRRIPYSPVYTIEEAIGDPHVKARKLFQEVDAGELGSIKEVVFPVKFSGFKQEITSLPPLLGQHTEEILKRLGCSDEEIALLKEKKAV